MFVGRRYGDFSKLYKQLQTEFPGKPLPPLPRKNKSSSTSSWWSSSTPDDDVSSVSSFSTQEVGAAQEENRSSRTLAPGNHHSHQRSLSRSSGRSGRSSVGRTKSPRASSDESRETVLYREEQRVSLRAFLRTLLQHKRLSESKAMQEFLTSEPISLTDDDLVDIQRRKEVDSVRIEEQKRFYEIARQRAAELDVYMEKFRRDIVESNGLTKLFAEIREKQTVADLSPQYQKFAEWLRIEYALPLYNFRLHY